uniref:Uncharacterized protein n=1 Tax=Cannabis sativa TaxID=3483 RepID=A0A803P7D7_CANSA
MLLFRLVPEARAIRNLLAPYIQVRVRARLRTLAGKRSNEPLGHPRAKVAQTTCGRDVVESSLPLPPSGPAPCGKPMIYEPLARREFMKLGFLHDNSWGSSRSLREQVKTLEAALQVKDQTISEMEALGLEDRSLISSLETMLGLLREHIGSMEVLFESCQGLDQVAGQLMEAVVGPHSNDPRKGCWLWLAKPTQGSFSWPTRLAQGRVWPAIPQLANVIGVLTGGRLHQSLEFSGSRCLK